MENETEYFWNKFLTTTKSKYTKASVVLAGQGLTRIVAHVLHTTQLKHVQITIGLCRKIVFMLQKTVIELCIYVSIYSTVKEVRSGCGLWLRAGSWVGGGCDHRGRRRNWNLSSVWLVAVASCRGHVRRR